MVLVSGEIHASHPAPDSPAQPIGFETAPEPAEDLRQYWLDIATRQRFGEALDAGDYAVADEILDQLQAEGRDDRHQSFWQQRLQATLGLPGTPGVLVASSAMQSANHPGVFETIRDPRDFAPVLKASGVDILRGKRGAHITAWPTETGPAVRPIIYNIGNRACKPGATDEYALEGMWVTAGTYMVVLANGEDNDLRPGGLGFTMKQIIAAGKEQFRSGWPSLNDAAEVATKLAPENAPKQVETPPRHKHATYLKQLVRRVWPFNKPETRPQTPRIIGCFVLEILPN